jgi:hypothetical protein
MAPLNRLPQHAVRLPSYSELEQYVRAFAAGHLNLLLLFGPPGVGKSRCVRQALGSQVGWLSGQATPLGIYLQAYQHRHQLLVLDDVDGLYADRSGIRLLKALCQTERTKTLGWHTTAPVLDRLGIPRQFTTTSRVALVGNDWKTLNADVAALEDRGHVLVFEPMAVEVHRQAAGWFWDQEIFDFVAEHLHLMAQLSLRSYLQAWELKRAGLDWQHGVLCRCLTGTALLVARLQADRSFPSEAARVQAFVQAGAGCRATYFRHARKMQPAGTAPRIPLRHTTPPADALPETDHVEQRWVGPPSATARLCDHPWSRGRRQHRAERPSRRS